MLLPIEVTCIIPVYNEGSRVCKVLEAIVKIRSITQIICIDDGSTDNTLDFISSYRPRIELIVLSKNRGKAAAIRQGVKISKNENILLMDADLQHFTSYDLEKALQTAVQSKTDMLILRRANAPWFIKMYRADVLLSGERIIKKKDLKAVLRRKVSGYQLETAINLYMQENNKYVGWTEWSGLNTYKCEKMGTIAGVRNEIKMFTDIIFYTGFTNMIKQLALFARKEIKADFAVSTRYSNPNVRPVAIE